MLKIQRYFFTFLFIYLFTFSFALADDYEIKIESGTNKFKDLIFSVPPGSQHTGELVVYNDGEKNVDVVLFVASEKNASLVDAMKAKNGNDLFLNTFFYFDAPPEKYQDLLKENNGEINVLCENYEGSKDKALKKWCEGDRSTTVTIKAGESERVPFTVKFSPNAKEHQAYITAVLEDKHDNKVLAQKELIYQIPFERVDVDKVNFESFNFKRSFSLVNIFSWWKADKREEYIAEFVVHNDDNLSTNYEIFVRTNTGEEKVYKSDAVIGPEKTEVYEIKVPMPWFGKVDVVGGMKIGLDNNVQEFVSEKIRYFIIPVREIIFVLFIMTGLLVFMWKKKESLSNAIGGNSWVKYKIRQGDNIMSVSYRYGVSWKELVFRNKIKPPYTLISGNVIMVPPRPKKVFKNTFMQNKNNLDNLMDNREVHKKSFSNGSEIKVDVKGDSVKSVVQLPEKSQLEKKVINGINVKRLNSYNSMDPALVQQRDDSKDERVQRSSVINDRHQRFLNSRRPIKNIDINWIHEDDETFDEAMQDEVRAINLKIKMFFLGIIVLVGLVVWWFLNYGIEDNSSKSTASINDLLNVDGEENDEDRQNDSIDSDQQDEEESADDKNKDDANDDNENDSDDTKVEEDISASEYIKKSSEVSVQVLNGGAKPGVAGDITNLLKNKLYKTKSATNANNNVSGVVIYYDSEFSGEATELSKVVSQVYGKSMLEESNDVTKKHGVNVVVVVGK